MHYSSKLIFLLAAMATASSYPQAYAQSLADDERAVLRHVTENHQASIQFLEKTVNINSGTQNPKGVRSVGMIYKKFLEDIGFETRWIDMPDDMNRGGHLIGEIKGSKGKKLLLIGHIDTVFEEDSPFQQWQLKDSIAIGPGANDMKGGNMVMLFALKALYEAGQLKDRQIIVILHGDEENPGRPLDISRKDIIELAKRSDIALAYETGTGLGYATVARRGSSGWTLEVKGVQAHSSGVFGQNSGSGAIYEASRILSRFHEELREENLTYNPGLILGGTEVDIDFSGISGKASGKTNLVANTTVVKGDLRTMSNEQLQRTRAKMKAIVSENWPKTSAEITFIDGYPAMPPSEGNLSLLQVLNQVSLDLNQGEVKAYDPNRRGAGDIAFVADYVDCLDGLGVQGGGAHSPQEYVDLKSIEDIVKRSAILIQRLTQ